MIVVVGGHSRHAGKTTFIAALIRALREGRWTAIKVTPHAHERAEVFEETDATAGRDTSRYLAAGAARALLVRTEAAAALAAILQGAGNAIIESNSVLEWLRPDLAIMVVNASIPDCKPSARAFEQAGGGLAVVEHGDAAGFEAIVELVRTKMAV